MVLKFSGSIFLQVQAYLASLSDQALSELHNAMRVLLSFENKQTKLLTLKIVTVFSLCTSPALTM